MWSNPVIRLYSLFVPETYQIANALCKVPCVHRNRMERIPEHGGACSAGGTLGSESVLARLEAHALQATTGRHDQLSNGILLGLCTARPLGVSSGRPFADDAYLCQAMGYDSHVLIDIIAAVDISKAAHRNCTNEIEDGAGTTDSPSMAKFRQTYKRGGARLIKFLLSDGSRLMTAIEYERINCAEQLAELHSRFGQMSENRPTVLARGLLLNNPTVRNGMLLLKNRNFLLLSSLLPTAISNHACAYIPSSRVPAESQHLTPHGARPVPDAPLAEAHGAAVSTSISQSRPQRLDGTVGDEGLFDDLMEVSFSPPPGDCQTSIGIDCLATTNTKTAAACNDTEANRQTQERPLTTSFYGIAWHDYRLYSQASAHEERRHSSQPINHEGRVVEVLSSASNSLHYFLARVKATVQTIDVDKSPAPQERHPCDKAPPTTCRASTDGNLMELLDVKSKPTLQNRGNDGRTFSSADYLAMTKQYSGTFTVSEINHEGPVHSRLWNSMIGNPIAVIDGENTRMVSLSGELLNWSKGRSSNSGVRV